MAMIRRIAGRWYVVHHKARGLIGKPIASNPKGGHKSYKSALRQHNAIFMRRS